MPSFSLIVEFLTGYCVATDSANREKAEWPPHPARIFMAMAAAHFETEPTNQAQRAALEWFERLDPPDIAIPHHTVRDVLTVYVPVNDQAGGEALIQRSRQARFFPRVHIGTEPLRMTWRTPHENGEEHLTQLETICRSVTRIGHSSSLVWMRLERDTSGEPTHVPDEHALERGLRIVQTGTLKRLEEAFNISVIKEFAELEEQISVSKGKAKSQFKIALNERFPHGQPKSQRPVFSVSRGYRPITTPPGEAVQSQFDPNFIVLRQHEDTTQVYGVESTAMVTDTLRKLIMSKVKEVPSWVGGHEPNCDKLKSQNHMALIPLPFVGGKYADGHLMGLGIVMPREIPYRERARVLSPLLFDQENNLITLELRMGNVGVWKLVRETDFAPKQNLRTKTYTDPSLSWASVTPVLLDRMPKADRMKEPTAWREEVAGIIAQSCQNVGLPAPIAVRVEKTPFFRGSLRAMPGQGGFPQLRKGRFQVHVQIEFDKPVQGPLLLGSGRFFGYGLMRPWKEEVQ